MRHREEFQKMFAIAESATIEGVALEYNQDKKVIEFVHRSVSLASLTIELGTSTKIKTGAIISTPDIFTLKSEFGFNCTLKTQAVADLRAFIPAMLEIRVSLYEGLHREATIAV